MDGLQWFGVYSEWRGGIDLIHSTGRLLQTSCTVIIASEPIQTISNILYSLTHITLKTFAP